ncbi:MAG: hypothetical protein ABJB16_15055 [Saprospiraceae bacterium]
MKSLIDVPSRELIGRLEGMMVHQNENYILAVYRNKFDDPTKIKPRDGGGTITAIAESVNDADEVLAFIDTDTFLLSEVDAEESSSTIVFIGDGAREDINFSDPTPEENHSSSRHDELNFEVDSWKIQSGHRYENDHYSEIIVYAVQFLDNGTVTRSYDCLPFRPKSVYYLDIDNTGGGTVFNTNEGLWATDQTEFNNDVNVHLGAYEYDWYSSKKNLTPTCADDFPSFTGVGRYCRMKYSNEWYFFECLDLPARWPTNNTSWTLDVSNAKCDFRVLRND